MLHCTTILHNTYFNYIHCMCFNSDMRYERFYFQFRLRTTLQREYTSKTQLQFLQILPPHARWRSSTYVVAYLDIFCDTSFCVHLHQFLLYLLLFCSNTEISYEYFILCYPCRLFCHNHKIFPPRRITSKNNY